MKSNIMNFIYLFDRWKPAFYIEIHRRPQYHSTYGKYGIVVFCAAI